MTFEEWFEQARQTSAVAVTFEAESWARAAYRAAGASEGQAEPKAWFVETPSGTVADITVNEIDAIAWHETGHIVHPLYLHPSAEIAALRERIAGMEKDAERLLWFSRRVTVEMLNAYTNHVLSRGGDGDLSDIRTFIDAAIAKEQK